MSRGIVRGLGLALLLLPSAPGCGLLFPAPPGPLPAPGGSQAPDAGSTAASAPPPALTGTLRQDQVSVTLRHGDLQVRVTPLAEWVIGTTAPDTHERLSVLARSYQEIFLERTGSAVPFQLVLVSLYSETSGVDFEPEDLNLVNRGLRYRPADIYAVTPDWDTRRLQPRQAAMAVYAFPPELDLERSTEIEYRDLRSRDWDRVLPLIQSERARRP